uniref:E3 ubiquitin-protein ligase NRDP1 n=1 Tax=Magallana gigas TaxID=29159 RepID=K1Q2Z3_MAGGI
MGYELNRFQGDVDEELVCPICSGVLEEPLQAPQCEHAFCGACIQEWLTRQPTCPVDRNPITPNQLKPVPRILRNLLSRLQIACDNATYGCTAVVKLDMLSAHIQECEHNPKKPVHCESGCGIVVPKDELKEYMRSMRVSNPRMREIQSEMENADVLRWVNSLQTARVTRWGGMISTPDAVLQAVIKRALIDSGSPPHIVNELMENAHERRWPNGLSTLETRQLNRRQYENYVTKRIPGKQAVVVMSCENEHMPDDLIMEPGLVMIFAHGVE